MIRFDWFALVIVLAGMPVVALAAPAVHGKTFATPALHAGDAAPIPLDAYWRGNLKHVDGALVDNKPVTREVPNLIEYRVTIATGGHYELQAQYMLARECPATLTFDGEPAGVVFDKPPAGGDWTTLGTVAWRAGPHTIRLTSKYVETPFPKLTALRLVLRDATEPPQPPRRDRRSARQATGRLGTGSTTQNPRRLPHRRLHPRRRQTLQRRRIRRHARPVRRDEHLRFREGPPRLRVLRHEDRHAPPGPRLRPARRANRRLPQTQHRRLGLFLARL